jgi:hypothetical protein
MTNIPTELLRTLVAVVDLRSFTKAAQSLGVTQPAVSSQTIILKIALSIGQRIVGAIGFAGTLSISGDMAA